MNRENGNNIGERESACVIHSWYFTARQCHERVGISLSYDAASWTGDKKGSFSLSFFLPFDGEVRIYYSPLLSLNAGLLLITYCLLLITYYYCHYFIICFLFFVMVMYNT
ncbi:hypothetical protein J3Q64DRAFT_1748530 [Phycomyces blakesleeanus]|uniref:Uncharacterized protein n=1 Tax=Phycomyces blakesleeanus TaxID=4837 RepID=A0ABR3AVQ5_PHYBL